ncbi:diguanylate cyclase [uncultured Paraglaciecola sp.]|uniref:sensor domain-containing diguanylate cyclase n=1 Tax=uncultured Paraglaciecola sp. TaxID=1765024 RepID=UPI0030DD735B|tara:strand:+ start:24988 stop:26376 length:1389 start_codon:yes stop_codon:yes gene_type:complete
MQKISNLDTLKLFESAHIGVVIHTWDTSIVYANPQALNLLRLTYEQIIGKDSYDSQWHFIDDQYQRLATKDYPVNRVVVGDRIQNKVLGVIDGSKERISWLMVNAYAEHGLDDTGFVVVTFIDVTDSRQGFSFEQIVENAQDIVVVTESDKIKAPLGPKIVYVNKAFEKLTGYSKEEIKGETPRILQGSLTDKEGCKKIHDALVEKKPVAETLLNYSKTGQPYWLDINIIPLFDRNGEVTHFAAIERDVTENRFHLEQLKKRNEDLKLLKDELKHLVEERTRELQQANEKLALLAYFDPLTQIPNRRYFIDQTTRLIHFCQRHEYILAIGILDIDDFKLVNDKHGHDVGDEVLSALGGNLKKFFRLDDAYCRWGGEEFAFAVVSTDVKSMEKLCQRLLKVINEMTISCSNGFEFSINVSIGVCMRQADPNESLDTYMKIADDALYNAKSKGKNRVSFSTDIN